MCGTATRASTATGGASPGLRAPRRAVAVESACCAEISLGCCAQEVSGSRGVHGRGARAAESLWRVQNLPGDGLSRRCTAGQVDGS
eukprot:1557973-Rhodomonas_salina.5